MTALQAWLRSPRTLMIFFILLVCLPAAALVGLSFQLLDLDREKRQRDLLSWAADEAVLVLERDFAALRTHLQNSSCAEMDVDADSVCVTFHADRIEAVPPGRIPYYPQTQQLKEAPSLPFEQADFYEHNKEDFQTALKISDKLAVSSDPSIRAGALLRRGRILRRVGEAGEALLTYAELSRIRSVSINQEPADLVARRTRCAILSEQRRFNDLRQEAESLAADLTAGKWQLDFDTFQHVKNSLDSWLGPSDATSVDGGLDRASALEWIYEQWKAPKSITTSGVHALNGKEGPVTVLWSFGEQRNSVFIAGRRYLESHWMAEVAEAVHPARIFVAGTLQAETDDRSRLERSAAATGLPWTLVVTPGEGQPEPAEFAATRRNLAAGLGALLILIAVGSWFIWRAMNRELAVARLQSEFVSAVSHEFRTPLTALRQFNELLQEEDEPARAKRYRYYQAQARATERLHRLVESLLDFGRMEAGRHPYRFKPIDAGALVHDVTEEFLNETGGRGFNVKYDADGGPHPVSADVEAISRALWNLLDNAVKYSGDSRTIELNLFRDNGAVAIAVRDYGIGIPTSEQNSIFQKFVRGAASISGGIRGTGIGLAMVRHIVEAHGGSVNVKSAEGKGSTFTIVLPART